MDLVNKLLQEHRTRNLLWAVASVVLIGLLLSLATYRWLIRPVSQMTGTLSRSRWYQPRDPAGGDELQRLAASIRHLVRDAEQALVDKDRLLDQVRTFNDKLEREIRNVREELTATQAELVRKERLSAVGALAAALAHELRNPLHIIRGDAELLSRREAHRETCADILEEVDRINRFVNELLDYTRPIERSTGQAEVAQVLESAVEAVRRTCEAQGVSFEVVCPPELELEIDPDHLRQIVVNLASNGVQAMAQGGRLSIEARTSEQTVRVEVTDTGAGIEPADLERLFEPFFTRRPAGTGLGLAIVKRLVELYDGALEVASDPGQGTRVTVSFGALTTGGS
jgi:two-component system sensor histidine kinase HydH